MKRILVLATAWLIATGVNALGGDAPEAWTQHCASCHGKDGKGETKAGKKAGAKSFTDPKYQAALNDEQMIKQIKEGMKDKSGKELMKPFGDKLSEDEIKGLIAYVKAFKK